MENRITHVQCSSTVLILKVLETVRSLPESTAKHQKYHKVHAAAVPSSPRQPSCFKSCRIYVSFRHLKRLRLFPFVNNLLSNHILFQEKVLQWDMRNPNSGQSRLPHHQLHPVPQDDLLEENPRSWIKSKESPRAPKPSRMRSSLSKAGGPQPATFSSRSS